MEPHSRCGRMLVQLLYFRLEVEAALSGEATGSMRRRKRWDEATYRPTSKEVLEVLELMLAPTSLEGIALAVDANRRAFRGGLSRTSASALLAVLEQLEQQGVVEARESGSLLPGAGPMWWSVDRWEERRRQEEERQAAADEAAADRAKLRAAQWRTGPEISEALREERAKGGSPLKRAVDATREENDRMYKEHQRRMLGEGGAS